MAVFEVVGVWWLLEAEVCCVSLDNTSPRRNASQGFGGDSTHVLSISIFTRLYMQIPLIRLI